ncbi:MAG: transposase [Nitrospirae bacterium]|nr:transposase [Nitrospirota bacterium]
MARPLRIEYDGAVYHVTSRGNARKSIFKDDEDRIFFLDTLKKVNDKYNLLCHAYCLMNNHYHLVIETPDGNLSKGMRQINGVYTQLYNKRHDRVGHIFQGRYKAILIQKESHLLEVSRYVVLNPVRAKAVKHPDEWKWSSYRGTAGKDNPHPCLTTDWILGQFGSKRRQSEKKYSEFITAGINEEKIWGNVKGQSILGEDEFIEKFKRYIEGYKKVKEIPRSQRYVGRPELKKLLKGAKGKREISRKTKEAVQRYGYSQREIADYIGIHYSTVSRLVNKGPDPLDPLALDPLGEEHNASVRFVAESGNNSITLDPPSVKVICQ